MATKKGTFQDYQGNELRPDLSAQELLDKIKTVDGTGSGLDAGVQTCALPIWEKTHRRRFSKS